MTYEALVSMLKKTDVWYLYGSGITSYNIYISLNECFGIMPDKVIVSKKQDKEVFFNEKSIYELIQLRGEDTGYVPVIIATPSVYHDEIVSTLVKQGYKNTICIDDNMYYEITAGYFRRMGTHILYEDIVRDIGYDIGGDVRADVDVRVYMAKSHRDKKINNDYYIYGYIEPIQVGASLTDVIMEKTMDNTGDNISEKNPDYCELTATYWAWKNSRHDYKGICHYRRMLTLDESDISYIGKADVDVVLPLPHICRNNASEQYGRYLEKGDIDNLWMAISDTYPRDLEKSKLILGSRYIYNYNMLIARNEIFDDYCEWMFRILERAEYYCADGKVRNDRYAGYLGELLTDIYFTANKDKMKIAHCGRIWMV